MQAELTEQIGYEKSESGEKPNAFWVVCKTCFASGGPGATKKEASENWNRRTP
jgi:cytochrome c5